MPRVKKELTREEQELFNELKKLSKRANQRIVRLEREFGKDTWATKYLKEKLATEPLQQQLPQKQDVEPGPNAGYVSLKSMEHNHWPNT